MIEIRSQSNEDVAGTIVGAVMSAFGIAVWTADPTTLRKAVAEVTTILDVQHPEKKASPGHVGDPGLRDPDFPCADFDPGEQCPAANCETDGHYLCRTCRHRAASVDAD